MYPSSPHTVKREIFAQTYFSNYSLRVESRNAYHMILFNQWKLLLKIRMKSSVNTDNYICSCHGKYSLKPYGLQECLFCPKYLIHIYFEFTASIDQWMRVIDSHAPLPYKDDEQRICAARQTLPPGKSINGWELLIATPPCLIRMMYKGYVLLDRLCHLVSQSMDVSYW